MSQKVLSRISDEGVFVCEVGVCIGLYYWYS